MPTSGPPKGAWRNCPSVDLLENEVDIAAHRVLSFCNSNSLPLRVWHSRRGSNVIGEVLGVRLLPSTRAALLGVATYETEVKMTANMETRISAAQIPVALLWCGCGRAGIVVVMAVRCNLPNH